MFKNIARVALANTINFGSSFIVGFILPAVLSVAAYGYYKEYTLYLSFVYLFNIGFNDGIYIKYGGVDQDSLKTEELHEEHNFIRLFQFIIFIPMIVFSLFTQDIVLIFFSITTFFMTINTFHQNFTQAVGDFKVFSYGNMLRSSFYIISLLVAVFFIKSNNYTLYIALTVMSYLLLFVYFELIFFKKYGYNNVLSLNNKLSFFKVGFFILIANMSLTFVANLGNWVVNFGFGIEKFAQYSFQNSILNVLLLIINAVGLVFYNIISKNEDQQLLKMTKRVSLFLGVFGGIGFFVFKFIIESYLPKYLDSIPLLSVTFIAIPYIMVSKILIANLYKARKNEVKYFRDSVLFAIGSLGIVYTAYFLNKTLLSIAIATTACYVLWYGYTTYFEYSYLKNNLKETLLLGSHMLIFYYSAVSFSVFTGFAVYFIYMIIVSIIFKKELHHLIKFSRK